MWGTWEMIIGYIHNRGLLWPKARSTRQRQPGHKGINSRNIHVVSQLLAILVIPRLRPGRQFSHMLRQWHYPLVRLDLLAQHLVGSPRCIAPLVPYGGSGSRTLSPPQQADELLYDPDCCSCGLEWRCIPHDACFIHDSCLCKGSGSFPPCKPQCPSWAQYSYDWYCELAASLSLHPHSLLPHFGSEVEPDVMFFGLSDPPS